MPRGIMVVESSPASPDRDDEYNQWYSKVHMPEVLAVPGFLSGRRYRVPAGTGSAHAYLAIYEIEGDDLTAPFAELRARSASGAVQRSDVMGTDPAPVVRFFELVEEQQAQP